MVRGGGQRLSTLRKLAPLERYVTAFCVYHSHELCVGVRIAKALKPGELKPTRVVMVTAGNKRKRELFSGLRKFDWDFT